MSVLEREALEQSPLADLHAIASELSIDSYRLLRRQQLVDAILARQDGAEEQGEPVSEAETKPRRRRARRPSGARRADAAPAAEAESQPEPKRSGSTAKPKRPEPTAEAEPERPEASKASTSDRARFESLPAKFPDQPFKFDSDDPLLSAIESLTPIGKGSRVTITGPARSGKSDALRRLAAALAARDDVELLVVLVGVRPEEIAEWQHGAAPPAEALSFASPTSAQDRAVYGALDRARSIAVSGGHVVVLLDTLDVLHEQAARRALAAARQLVDGGSVTVIATASEPAGGETTVLGLDPLRSLVDRVPALDLLFSGTLRADLLVGEEGAAAIARAYADAVGRPQPDQ